MGQCFTKKASVSPSVKQDKNIDDKRMLKVGIEVMKKDFCVQIGYNRRAVKTYGHGERGPQNEDLKRVAQPDPSDIGVEEAFSRSSERSSGLTRS